MTSFLKEMETIIKENEKLREENEKLKDEKNGPQNLYNENIELRIKLNEKNREISEISEILISLDKYKQDKISRGKKIGSLIKQSNEIIIEKDKLKLEKDKLKLENEKLKIEKDKLKGSFDLYHKNAHEKAKMMQTQLSKYKMGINQQDKLKKWFDENCGSFNYRLGKELHDIIN
jgi:hypothetical protein